MEEDIIEIGVSINILESLVKILLESSECDNIKKYDNENLAHVILEKIVNIKEKVNLMEEKMEI